MISSMHMICGALFCSLHSSKAAGLLLCRTQPFFCSSVRGCASCKPSTSKAAVAVSSSISLALSSTASRSVSGCDRRSTVALSWAAALLPTCRAAPAHLQTICARACVLHDCQHREGHHWLPRPLQKHTTQTTLQNHHVSEAHQPQCAP
jgi:hypothetical protein